jgi:hypothetical protein
LFPEFYVLGEISISEGKESQVIINPEEIA